MAFELIDPRDAQAFLRFARENNIELHPENKKLLCAVAGMCGVCGKVRDLNIAYDQMMCKKCERDYPMKKGKFLLRKEEEGKHGTEPTDSTE